MTKSAWTDEHIDRLRTLWREGRTAEQIARELQGGISRSAVLGKVHRLGLSAGRPGRPPASRGAGSERPGAKTIERPVERGDGRAPSDTLGTAPDLPSRGLTILTVRHGQCRWPYGNPGEPAFSLCGRPVARGVYCEAHALVGYRTPPGGAQSLLGLAGLG